MDGEIIQPHPSLRIRTDDRRSLPLSDFQILVVVEPNPETWTLSRGEEAAFTYRTRLLSELIMDELTEDYNREAYELLVVLWIKGSLFPYSNPVVEELSDLTITSLFDYGHLEHLGYYISGVSLYHPDWQAAVIGAADQQEVIRVGNVLQDSGLWTTVLGRYCYPIEGLQPYLKRY
jgi:hypothetical protein